MPAGPLSRSDRCRAVVSDCSSADAGPPKTITSGSRVHASAAVSQPSVACQRSRSCSAVGSPASTAASEVFPGGVAPGVGPIGPQHGLPADHLFHGRARRPVGGG